MNVAGLRWRVYRAIHHNDLLTIWVSPAKTGGGGQGSGTGLLTSSMTLGINLSMLSLLMSSTRMGLDGKRVNPLMFGDGLFSGSIILKG